MFRFVSVLLIMVFVISSCSFSSNTAVPDPIDNLVGTWRKEGNSIVTFTFLPDYTFLLEEGSREVTGKVHSLSENQIVFGESHTIANYAISGETLTMDFPRTSEVSTFRKIAD